MPLGAVEAQGKLCFGSVGSVGDLNSLLGPAMTLEHDIPEPRFPEVELGLAATEISRREFTLNVSLKNIAPEEIVKVLQGSQTDVSSSVREEITSTFSNLIKSEVRQFVETADKGGYLLGPLTVAVRIRLTDGAVVTIPSPRLLITNSEPLRVGILSAVKSGASAHVRCVILAQPAVLCTRVKNEGSFRDSVAAVEVVATQPVSLWNSSAEPYLGDIVIHPRTCAGTYLGDGRLTEVSVSRLSYRSGTPSRGWSFYGTASPASASLSSDTWYKVGELSSGLTESDSWSLLPLSGAVSSVFSGKGVGVDFSGCQYILSAWVRRIGDRVLAVSPEFGWPCPGSGIFPVEYDSAGRESGCILKEVLVYLTDGRVISSGELDRRFVDPASGWLRGWRYPMTGSRQVCFRYLDSSGVERIARYSLKDDEASGSSVISSDVRILSSEEDLALKVGADYYKMMTPRVDPELMIDWKADGPAIVPTASRLRIPGSRLAGIARVLPGVSGDIYPAIYLFASDGIRILRRQSDGSWRPERLLSGDSCLNPSGIVETTDSVAVITRFGLRRLVNTVITDISLPVMVSETSVLTDLPGAVEFVGSVTDSEDREHLLSSGSLWYFQDERVLWLMTVEGSLYYDMAKGSWINSREDSGGWMLTAPMDLGMDRIRSVEFFGCRMNGELKVALYVSDYLGHWRLAASGWTRRGRFGTVCGSGGRFWRLLVVGSLPEGVCLMD